MTYPIITIITCTRRRRGFFFFLIVRKPNLTHARLTLSVGGGWGREKITKFVSPRGSDFLSRAERPRGDCDVTAVGVTKEIVYTALCPRVHHTTTLGIIAAVSVDARSDNDGPRKIELRRALRRLFSTVSVFLTSR